MDEKRFEELVQKDYEYQMIQRKTELYWRQAAEQDPLFKLALLLLFKRMHALTDKINMKDPLTQVEVISIGIAERQKDYYEASRLRCRGVARWADLEEYIKLADELFKLTEKMAPALYQKLVEAREELKQSVQ